MMKTIAKVVASHLLIAVLLWWRPLAATAAADDTYCGPGDVAQFGSTDGPASLPRRCVYTAMPDVTKPPYSQNRFCVDPTGGAGGNSCYKTIGAAATDADSGKIPCGSVITIKAAAADGTQNVYPESAIPVTAQCNASAWIIVASDRFQDANFPAEGSRISPAWANPAAASLIGRPAYQSPAVAGVYVPKVVVQRSNTPAFQLKNAGYWRFVGLEVTAAAGMQETASLIALDSSVDNQNDQTTIAGDHVILDRMILHGGDSLNGSIYNGGPGSTNQLGENYMDTSNAVAGRRMRFLAVVDSYVFDTLCTGRCVDSHAVTFGGNDPWINEGPFKVVNNFLETAGESFFAGGGGTAVDANGHACCTIPMDIEIRRNLSYKPALIWQMSFPSSDKTSTCNGGRWTGCVDNPNFYGLNNPNLPNQPIIKNLGEFKTGSRVLIEGNVFENNWGGQSDQFGQVLSFNPVSQNNNQHGCASSDGNGNVASAPCAPGVSGSPIVFTPDSVSQYCANPGHCLVTTTGYKPDPSTPFSVQSFLGASQITVTPAPPAFTGQVISQCEPGMNPNASSFDDVVRFNVMRHAAKGFEATTYKSGCRDYGKTLARISFHDNQLDDIDGWKWNVKAGACCSWGNGVHINNDNADPTIATNNVSIMHNTFLVAQENNAGTEGAVNASSTCGPACTTQMSNIIIRDNLGAGGLEDHGGVKNDYCAASKLINPATTLFNCLAGNSWTITGNAFSAGTLPSLPAPSSNTPFPDNNYGSQSQAQPADYTSYAFVNLNNANGGDYHLASGSPYKGKGDDGLDPGADIDAVDSRTAGVETGGAGAGGDQTPPAIAITAPAAGATINGVASIAGTASDNVAVSKVELSTDGAHFNPASGTASWSYSLDTTKIPDGPLTVTARATDTSGNQNTVSVSVTVSNNAGQITAGPFINVTTDGLTATWTSSYPHGTLYRVSLSTGVFPNAFAGNQSSVTANDQAAFSGLNPKTLYYAQVSTSPSGPFVSLGSTVTLAGVVTITQAAAASPNPVSGMSTGLTVSAADSAYPSSQLVYTWTQSSGPALATISINGSNAAASSTATFAAAGNYAFFVTAQDPGGSVAQSTVAVTVSAQLSSIAISPAQASVSVGGAQPFAASGSDQFGHALTPQPSFAWSVSGGGAMSPSGVFTAGAVPGGPFHVTASAAGVSGEAAVVIVDTTAPAVAISSPTNGAQVTGIVSISATASDDGSVAWVQLQVDGSNLGTRLTTPPYAVKWNTGLASIVGGFHTLTAVAADEAGNQAVSARVVVYVKPTRIVLAYAASGGSPQDGLGGPIGFTQAQFVLEAGDPAFPDQPAVSIAAAMPSGSKNLTLTQISSGVYSATVSSSLFNAQDFGQSGTTITVTANGLAFAIALNGDAINPATGGVVVGADGSSAFAVAAGQLNVDAQIGLAPAGQGPQSSGGALSRQGLALLGPIEQLSQASSATLSSAQLMLSFDPARIPRGLDPSQVRMGWYDPNAGIWQLLSNTGVNGSVMTAGIGQFGQFAPLAILPSSTPGPRSCYIYPNPAVLQDPTLRIFTGTVDDVEVTVYDVAGRAVRSGSASGAPTGIANGDYYYDVPLGAGMASGGYFFAAHAKTGGSVLKCRGKFAVVR